MVRYTLRRYLSLLLICIFLLSGFPATVCAGDDLMEPPAEEITEPTGETAAPAEETTESTEEAPEPTEESTEPVEESTEPTTEPAADPTEEPPDSAEASTPNQILPIDDGPDEDGPNLYFGQLHAHPSLSDDTETVETVFQTAVSTAGLDFFAVTEYSDSFDNAASGSLTTNGSAISQAWAAGKTAASAITGADFTGIFGFEMNWPEQMQIGHISVFNTPGFQSWSQDAYQNPSTVLKTFYEALASVPGTIAQWNHPGNQYGTFFNFDHYSREADRVITLLEVANSEVTTAAGYLDGYQYYTRALDKGWHVAPTNSQGQYGRTVICAQTLTEADLYDAMQNYRVYATEDSDLEIIYTMDGYSMGSQLKKWHTGETADIIADLYDPTDSAIGLVEVIVDGGVTAARQTVSTSCDVLRFSLPADYSYYYLRITQPDGDIAVTAPIWMEDTENLGISNLVCKTEVPVQGEEITLTLTIDNREDADLLVESLEILADGVTIAEDTELSEISAGSQLSHDLAFRYDGIGQTEITVILSGTLAGTVREYKTSLTLSFRQSKQVTDIVIDGSHGNTGLSDLGIFKTLAAKEDIRVTVAAAGITQSLLEGCRFLVVTAPSEPFSDDFLAAVVEYVRYGGSILVCGQSDALDGAVSSADALNRLLAAIGSTMRLGCDTVVDSMYHGGEESLLFPEDINANTPWCAGLTSGQVYRHAYGCSVSPGNGTALVNSRSTSQSTSGVSPVTMLAWEQTQAGGAVLAAGSLLPGNNELKEPSNIWDAPYANRTIVQNLLGIGGEVLPLSTIRQAREAEAGTLLRIRGYVTAGTSNPYNHFPDTLYLQDDTGGIAVMPFTAEGISVGTPVEITGAAEIREGNRILKTVSWEVLNGSLYKYLPKTGSWKTLLDPNLHGGELVEVEGKCTEVILADDGYVSGITLKDSDGNHAHVLIEDYIFSGTTGENDLHEDIRKDRTVRAMGLLHVDKNGDAVIRVRNCEEVVYVPPRRFYINPKTGDPVMFPTTMLLTSAAVLTLLKKKRI